MRMEKLLKKIEHLDEDERSKLKKLLKEKSSDGDKVDWIYKEDLPDNEEYLLGRKVDHHIDTTRHDGLKDVPGALYTVSDEILSKRAEMDMEVKMREDPLYAIKQKEEDAKRRLLENPIKMKQLQKLVQEREEQLKKKKKKKKKKKNKRKRNSSESSDSSDDELINKYLAIVRQKENSAANAKDSSQSKHSSTSHDGEKDQLHHRKDSHGKSHSQHVSVERDRKERPSHRGTGDRQPRGKKHYSDSDDESSSERQSMQLQKKDYGLIVRGKDGSRSKDQKTKHFKNKSRRSHSREKVHRSRSRERVQRSLSRERVQRSKDRLKRSRSRERVKRSRSRDRIKRSRSRSRDRERAIRSRDRSKRSRERSPRKTLSPVSKKFEPKKKLSREEMERKRVAMQENAAERDVQREENVKRYREDAKKEEELMEKTRDKAAEFVSPMMAEHAAQSSVADRIKRNIYNIQRTTADLDKKFTKH